METQSFQTFTLSGSSVVELHKPIGQTSIQWDATNSSGDKVAGGLYYYVISGSGLNEKGRIVIIR